MKWAIKSKILLCILITSLWLAIVIFLVCGGLIPAQSTLHSSYCQSLLRRLMIEHHQTQAVTQPTQGNAILDLMLISDTLTIDGISYLAPINCSDHNSQLLRNRLPCSINRTVLRRHVDYDGLRLLQSQTNWTASFQGCIVAENFAHRFDTLIFNNVNTCTSYNPIFRRQRLPRHIVQLLRAEKRAWRTSWQSRDTAPFKATSKTARAALRQYRRCEELRLAYSNNRKVFFSHMYRKSASHSGNSIQLCDGGNALSDLEATDILLLKFSSNFSSTIPSTSRLDKHTLLPLLPYHYFISIAHQV